MKYYCKLDIFYNSKKQRLDVQVTLLREVKVWGTNITCVSSNNKERYIRKLDSPWSYSIYFHYLGEESVSKAFDTLWHYYRDRQDTILKLYKFTHISKLRFKIKTLEWWWGF